ncbi:DUF192 domain-containing protein [Methanobrevibacter olleyae]|uniref:DUF192 domain-containing protein n=1 Tax=Methanobrevibacter olleyae TaxID=294671 RepID=A0A126R245_METOL|nr:DUF192 domain-containing protein [Methanobrevibacter olleyae]AMK16106.1 hypothetical protein YLM1_1551 [Methanobrevibacter olleyae]
MNFIKKINRNKEEYSNANEIANNQRNKNNLSYRKNDNLKILYLKNSKKIITKVKIANSFKKRLIGLMFKKTTKYPLLFEIPQKINIKEKSSIHSFFMRFEIRLVFIDRKNIIYEIADLKPWRYYVPKKPAKYIIEFDKIEFDNFDLKIGDEIEIK